jgi:hypothetical protein
MPNRLLGIFWHQALKFGLSLLMLEMPLAVRVKTAANSAQAFEALMIVYHDARALISRNGANSMT